jgi:hypothetical protein
MRSVQFTPRDWLVGLRDFIANERSSVPLSDGTVAAAAWTAERAILAAALATRLAEVDHLRAARRSPRRSHGVSPGSAADRTPPPDPDPAIVLTTSPAGLAAASDLLDHGGDLPALVGDRLVAVTEREYRLWCIRHPDGDHRLHLNLWNWVKTRVPPQRWPEFTPHTLGDGEAFWLHREGVAGAGALDRRTCRLWKWNGRHATLLEAFVPEQGVSTLRGGDAD